MSHYNLEPTIPGPLTRFRMSKIKWAAEVPLSKPSTLHLLGGYSTAVNELERAGLFDVSD